IRGQIQCTPATATPIGPTATPTIVPLSVSQAISRVSVSGQAGIPAALLPGQTVQVTGQVQGTGRVTSSMSWTLTANVPAGVAAGAAAATAAAAAAAAAHSADDAWDERAVSPSGCPANQRRADHGRSGHAQRGRGWPDGRARADDRTDRRAGADGRARADDYLA